MGFYNLETLKEDAKRHRIHVLNPDVNRSKAKCTIEDGKLRLGFMNVLGLGEASARSIEEGRNRQGSFNSISDFLERTGVLEEIAFNLASAGAFDSLESNRRGVKWEIGLRYRPVNCQLALPLPVEQDMVALQAPGEWERMKDEYNVLNLFPTGHVMAKLRPNLGKNIYCSKDIVKLDNGAEVITAGLVIRRQRPRGKVVFMTLEDEFGLIPLMVFPRTYERQEYEFKSPFLVIQGKLSRREGTYNVVVNRVKPFSVLDKAPQSKNWQ